MEIGQLLATEDSGPFEIEVPLSCLQQAWKANANAATTFQKP